MRIAAGVLTLALVVAGHGAFAAGTLQDAIAAYEKGDHATAVRLFIPIAEQGNAIAQYHLGLSHAYGSGVARNYATALAWYRRAADQGHAEAQYNVGIMYDSGLGVARDYATAVTWYRRAAEQGQAAAQADLGVMYERGLGVAPDPVEAHKWFALAASRHPPGRDRTLATRSRDHVARKMTAGQLSTAQRLAGEWKAKAEKP